MVFGYMVVQRLLVLVKVFSRLPDSVSRRFAHRVWEMHVAAQRLNRAENSHQPTRHCERAMKRFRTPGGAQRFLAVFSVISPHFRPRRHRLTADDYRTEMTRRFAVWNEVTGLTAAA